ncbi:MAG: propionyl-CoA synthetase [Steroidobacteraceae bacterium]|jgi:propionyl-CoA synthetase|nr:propionyl-CoA synthetase [Steroidobacteraceae bacterium]
MTTYREAYEDWRADPQGFWMRAAGTIDWVRPPTVAGDASRPPSHRWFPDGRLNACHNAVDRHVAAGRGEQVALLHVSAMTGQEQRFTFGGLRDEVARLAGALRALGVARGDRVVIYMPMVPEAVFAMLACARLGAIHSVVFGGFAARELAMRIDDARPVLLLTASCGLEPGRVVDYKALLDRALELASHRPAHCLVLQRPQLQVALEPGRDLDWRQAVDAAQPADCVPVGSTDPLYILYTSGTTGKPKGVVRDTGGYLVALDWSMRHVYGARPGEVYWAASDIGWVVGHSYIVYGPLVHGCTTLMYEGKPVGTPDASAYWRIVERHRVRTLFTAPTAIRAIKREDPAGEKMRAHDTGSLRALFLAGERADPDTVQWAAAQLKVPVIDHWWQTETGWPMAANCLGIEMLPVKPGSPTRPVPGYEIVVLDAAGESLPAGTQGALAVRLPLPPGSLPTLWNDDEGYRRAYLAEHPGYYTTGDGGYLDADGYVFVMGRTDDVINVAGHRLSTGEFEEVLAAHPQVAECAVVGVADELKGTVPVGLVVLKAGVQADPQALERELVARIRDEVGPVASFHRCLVVQRLPKTRSGKVLRATMRAIADGRDYAVPATIEDPAVLGEIASAFGRAAG